MRLFIVTDLEGVAGVDSFGQTRHEDMTDPERDKAPAMDQLAREVNAAIDGIRSVAPDAAIDVLDGHGYGGLREEDLEGGTYLRRPDFDPFTERDYDALLFVGQHAMAGTAFAPLRHTLSSLHVAYYKVNGTFIGEFGGMAIAAGLADVPTIFLSGDDKAAHEASIFAPEIETAVVKWGEGVEAARHRGPDDACDAVRSGAAGAVDRIGDVEPVTGFESPFTVEVRFREPKDAVPDDWPTEGVEITRVDSRTFQRTSDDFDRVYP